MGDVVAVNPPREKAYLAQVLYVEGGARTSDPNFVQVCRELDCHVMNICPSWIIERLPTDPNRATATLGSALKNLSNAIRKAPAHLDGCPAHVHLQSTLRTRPISHKFTPIQNPE